jgi:hypothetical protein
MENGHFLEVNIFSGSQEIHHIYWNPEVYYRIHNSPPPVPILNQINQAHVSPIQLLEDPF